MRLQGRQGSARRGLRRPASPSPGERPCRDIRARDRVAFAAAQARGGRAGLCSQSTTPRQDRGSDESPTGAAPGAGGGGWLARALPLAAVHRSSPSQRRNEVNLGCRSGVYVKAIAD